MPVQRTIRDLKKNHTIRGLGKGRFERQTDSRAWVQERRRITPNAAAQIHRMGSLQLKARHLFIDKGISERGLGTKKTAANRRQRTNRRNRRNRL